MFHLYTDSDSSLLKLKAESTVPKKNHGPEKFMNLFQFTFVKQCR